MNRKKSPGRKKKLDNTSLRQSAKERPSRVIRNSSCPEQYPKRQKKIETRTTQGGQVILRDRISNCSVTLSPIAAIAWEFCDGLNTTDSIVKAIDKLIENQNGLESQIRQLLNQLAEAGFLIFEPNPSKS